jgi:Zn-dependent protease
MSIIAPGPACYDVAVNSLGNIDPAQVIMGLAVLLFSLSIHESAHARAAEWRGDPTGRALGRITLNPVHHIDPIGTLLFPLMGLIFGGFIFGWAKPVPVNPNNFKNPRTDHVVVAAAGPGSNLVAAVGFLVGLKLLIVYFPSHIMAQHSVLYPLAQLFEMGVVLNVILLVFNLIPIPPLDGSWILAGLLPGRFTAVFDAIRPYGFMLLLVLLWSGMVQAILGPVLTLVYMLAA